MDQDAELDLYIFIASFGVAVLLPCLAIRFWQKKPWFWSFGLFSVMVACYIGLLMLLFAYTSTIDGSLSCREFIRIGLGVRQVAFIFVDGLLLMSFPYARDYLQDFPLRLLESGSMRRFVRFIVTGVLLLVGFVFGTIAVFKATVTELNAQGCSLSSHVRLSIFDIVASFIRGPVVAAMGVQLGRDLFKTYKQLSGVFQMPADLPQYPPSADQSYCLERTCCCCVLPCFCAARLIHVPQWVIDGIEWWLYLWSVLNAKGRLWLILVALTRAVGEGATVFFVPMSGGISVLGLNIAHYFQLSAVLLLLRACLSESNREEVDMGSLDAAGLEQTLFWALRHRRHLEEGQTFLEERHRPLTPPTPHDGTWAWWYALFPSLRPVPPARPVSPTMPRPPSIVRQMQVASPRASIASHQTPVPPPIPPPSLDEGISIDEADIDGPDAWVIPPEPTAQMTLHPRVLYTTPFPNGSRIETLDADEPADRTAYLDAEDGPLPDIPPVANVESATLATATWNAVGYAVAWLQSWR
jgi:hypothetical protein